MIISFILMTLMFDSGDPLRRNYMLVTARGQQVDSCIQLKYKKKSEFFFSGKIDSFLIFYFPRLDSSKQLNCTINDSHTNYFYESTYTTVVHCGTLWKLLCAICTVISISLHVYIILRESPSRETQNFRNKSMTSFFLLTL